jgi:rSAM/selenodomain-associated transferase 1
MVLLSNKNSDGDEMVFDFKITTSKKALIIFTRNPELGKCKTRLAKTVGDEAALKIYTYLLQHTAKVSEPVKADKYVFYSETINKNDLWNSEIFRKKLQYGSDLGSRMENAFSELFNLGYEKVMIIGSDLLDLNQQLIDQAFDQLTSNDVVIGPSKDGGYYLLGMNITHQDIFKNKAWGTESVLKDTLNDLQNYNVEMLEELNDIDTFEDMKHYRQLEQFYK